MLTLPHRTGWKRKGTDEYHGPCPITGAGEDCCWVRPKRGTIGCRKCGTSSGGLDKNQFIEHGVALEIPELLETGRSHGTGTPPLETWTWTAVDGRTRKQYRFPDKKTWSSPDKEQQPCPAPAELIYCPVLLDKLSWPLFACEGASSTDRLLKLGLSAVGYNNAQLGDAWAANLKTWSEHTDGILVVWPDHDPSGYAQGLKLLEVCSRAGLQRFGWIKPELVNPDLTPSFDPGDWQPEDEDLLDVLRPAVCRDLKELARRSCRTAWEVDEKEKPKRLLEAPAGEDEARFRHLSIYGVPDPETGPVDVAPPTPVPVPPGDEGAAAPPPKPVKVPVVFPNYQVNGIICLSHLDVARLIRDQADGHLGWIREENAWMEWIPFVSGGGYWTPIPVDEVRSRISATCVAHYGTQNADGTKQWLKPTPGGSNTTASGVMNLLAGMNGIRSSVSEWDSRPGLLGLPAHGGKHRGHFIDVKTGGKPEPDSPEQRIRWHLTAYPASPAQYERSKFRQVVEHVIRDDGEREYVQRRLGAALMDIGGLDDLIWLYGESNSGKGVFLQAIRSVFGSYCASIPPTELQRGGHRGHSEWKARLANKLLLTVDDIGSRDLDESVVKGLLGSEIVAHHMNQGSFDFTIRAPILATANDPPAIRNVDQGMKRRLKPIQGGRSIKDLDRDPKLRGQIREPRESGACLFWLIEGATKYLVGGAPVPTSVLDSVDDVIEETHFAEFAARWEQDETAWTDVADVYQEFQRFMVASGARPEGKKTLFSELRKLGWQKKGKHPGRRGWQVRQRQKTAPIPRPPVVNPDGESDPDEPMF